MKVNDLQPKDLKGVYKNVDLDMRQYKSLKMFIHAESISGEEKLPGEGVDEEFDKMDQRSHRRNHSVSDRTCKSEVIDQLTYLMCDDKMTKRSRAVVLNVKKVDDANHNAKLSHHQE